MSQSTAVSTDAAAGDFLNKFQKSLKDYAIRKYDGRAFLKSAMIAIADSPTLAECLKTDAGKRSLFNAMRYAATTGLSLNPQEGKAALIGYSGKIQYQVMKNGMIDLALESGKVEFITADYVRENDEFRITKSIDGDKYTFAPALRDRGGVLGYYAALKLASGATHVKWLTAEEVKAHREKYSKASQMPEIGYGVKTVMKALLRSVSISDALDRVIGQDDAIEAEFTVHGTTADDVAAALSKPDKPVKPEAEQGELL
jgi:phage RecT family recombinase